MQFRFILIKFIMNLVIIGSFISGEFDYFDLHVCRDHFPQLIFQIKSHHYTLSHALKIFIPFDHLFELCLCLFLRGWALRHQGQCSAVSICIRDNAHFFFIHLFRVFSVLGDHKHFISPLWHYCFSSSLVLFHAIQDFPEAFLSISRYRYYLFTIFICLLCFKKNFTIEPKVISMRSMIVLNFYDPAFIFSDLLYHYLK
ncbi:hypothetical protein FGO68_gene10592 [Halteria grandinella]|uniref:Uncharacterized protein n=1 Tax=Halteria grandinella TaxID=5974 RepID=A0A8J8T500_HALGN|nr:hypothetical protein FGO68_gene10592 [Halteria grandinella]